MGGTMKKRLFLSAVCCAVIMLVTLHCQSNAISLWNGEDFTGWEFFVTDEDVDVTTVWTVQNGVIHCTGVPNGYMRTVSDYENYTLRLEWRWTEKEGNSGVLLHAQMPDEVWPECIECQLQSGNAGNFVLIRAESITVDGETYTNPGRYVTIPKKQESNEKAIGEWNSYEITSAGGDITCYVNGVLQNAGTDASLTSGKICLQSEGAPIEFRNIRIELLK